MEPNKNWENRIEAGKQEFIRKFQKTYGEKYRNRIFKRLAELKEVKREYNLSPYLASSKQDYIVFRRCRCSRPRKRRHTARSAR